MNRYLSVLLLQRLLPRIRRHPRLVQTLSFFRAPFSFSILPIRQNSTTTPTPPSPPQNRKPNNLINSKSPYLLQHAYNPVNWHQWGEEAFEKARTENKPIFLSIGYSSCHWCRVMNDESFENESIAEILNQNFISIKVDREERPDVDGIYLLFVTAVTGHGGWPMSVFLTPDLNPYFGGTYFPNQSRHGLISFPDLCLRISDLWKKQPDLFREESKSTLEQLKNYINASEKTEKAEEDVGVVDDGRKLARSGLEHLENIFDKELGGFGTAPKFPRPAVFSFLNTQRLAFLEESIIATNNEDKKKVALAVAEMARIMTCSTLMRMARGGLRDHLAGGFHRYSVDELWHVPHFEKMLYDQAQLLKAYTEAFVLYDDPFFRDTATSTIDYLNSYLSAPEGGFYSSEDADSSVDGSEERLKKEGAFYVWTDQELKQHLNPVEYKLFARAYGVKPDGNILKRSDPQGEFEHKNHLLLQFLPSDLTKEFDMSLTELEEHLYSARVQLLAARNSRPRPHRDEKEITAWNGLMISSLASCAAPLKKKESVARATRAVESMKKNNVKENGWLLRSSIHGQSSGAPAVLSDYAFLIDGLLNLYEASGDVDHLRWAKELQSQQDILFLDRGEDGEQEDGYFLTRVDDSSLVLRLKAEGDNAEPAGNSIASMNLIRLGYLLNDWTYVRRARSTVRSFRKRIDAAPGNYPLMINTLQALDFVEKKGSAPPAPSWRVVIVGEPDEPATWAFLEEIGQRYFLPGTMDVLHLNKNTNEFFEEVGHDLKTFVRKNDAPTAYLCAPGICYPPVTNPLELFQSPGPYVPRPSLLDVRVSLH